MARPEKRGLSSFAFDVDFFNDEKIEAIANEFGIKGEIVAVKLLCAIYRNGYFIEWNDTYRTKLHRNLSGISLGLLDTIVLRLVKWAFFDKDLFDSTHVLTSKGIQRRYFSETRRRRNTQHLPYLLIEDEMQSDNEKPVSKDVQEVATSVTDFTEDHKPSIQPVITPPPSTDTYNPDKVLLEDLRNQTVIRENLCMKFGLSPEDLLQKFEQFEMDCRCREVCHNNRKDVINHFFSWLNKQTQLNLSNNGTNQGNKRRGTDAVSATTEDYVKPF